MVTVVHQTDLYRPHQDPDDHWDLACQYALAKLGQQRLGGILLDYPYEGGPGDPDICAIAQMNRICGMNVPYGIGAEPGKTLSQAAELLLSVLAESPVPVAVHIVGSCIDVALALNAQPERFERNCAAIYLHAGAAQDDRQLEYNVALAPWAYARVHAAPCPVYWLPCFHRVPDWGKEDMRIGKHGTFYRFVQGDILRELPPRVQNYFLYMFTRCANPRYLMALEQPVDKAVLAQYSAQPRNMWCTAGFLHAAGWAVNARGELIPVGSPQAIYDFMPVKVVCTPEGRTEWSECQAENAHSYLFTLRDEDAYAQAMTQAMRTILRALEEDLA